MYTIQQNMIIRRPIEDVFEVLCRIESRPKWEDGVVEIQNMSEGPQGIGFTWREVRKSFGLRFGADYVTTEYQLYKIFGFKNASGRFQLQGKYLVEPFRDGSSVFFTFEIRANGIVRLFESFIGNSARKRLAGFHENLKTLLETYGSRAKTR